MSKQTTKRKRKRPRSRRAIISKAGQVLVVMGCLCIFMGILMMVSSIWVPSRPHRQISLGGWYIASGFVLILGRSFTKWLIRFMDTQNMKRSREHAERHHAPR